MPQLDSLKTTGGLLRSAGFKNRDVSIYPSDEDINQIASMPLEEIKSELAQMGALDIPIPTRSAFSETLKASSKCEAEPKQDKSAIWGLRRVKEIRLAWLESKSSLRVGMSELALASLILIVSSGSLVYLLKPEDNISIPAPTMPDLLDTAARVPITPNGKTNSATPSEGLGTKAPPMKETPQTHGDSDVTSLQRTPRQGRKIDSHIRTVTRLEANKREAREPESRTRHQLPATSNLTRLVLEITQKGKQEDVLVSSMEMRQPFDE